MAAEDEIRGMINYAQQQINAYQKKIGACEELIAKLKPVYDRLGELKEEFRQTRKSTEKIFDQKGKWRGNTYNEFCSAGEALDDSYEAYYKQLDVAQDAVNSKIGELRAEIAGMIPIIGNLAAQINRWWVDIQNLTNR